MKTLKKSLIALFSVAVLFACSEDDLVLPASDGVNPVQEYSRIDGPSDGDDTPSYDSGISSGGSAQDVNDDTQEDQDIDIVKKSKNPIGLN